MKKNKISQGTVLPTTGIGVFYIFLLIDFSWWLNIGSKIFTEPMAYVFLFLFSIGQFLFKEFVITQKDGFEITYRYLGIRIYIMRFKWKNFEHFVFRVLKTNYRVAQSGTGGMLSSKYREEKNAIIGRMKDSGKIVLICKGEKKKLLVIANEFLLCENFTVYWGAPKKGYEMNKVSDVGNVTNGTFRVFEN